MNDEKKIKVLHVVGAMNRGGTETMLMNMYRHIDREKYHFDFISYSDQEAHYDAEIKQMNGNIIRLTRPSSMKQIYEAMKRYGPYDVVHAHTLFHSGIATLAARCARVKIIISHAHTTSDNNHTFLRKLYIKLMRSLIKICSTHLLACSKEAGLYLYGEKEMTLKKYTFVPNIIDYSHFLSPSSRDVKRLQHQLKLKDNQIVIGHIGTFKTSKNHAFILEIVLALIEQNIDVKVLLVGDGELKQQIKTKVEQKNLTHIVEFLGVRHDVATILHCLDVFVFPSTYEGLGLVLLEAQASGIPCVVSEAIQPEADMNLNLINKLALSDHSEYWAHQITQLIGKKETNQEKIRQQFNNSIYCIEKSMQRLTDIYSTVTEGLYD